MPSSRELILVPTNSYQWGGSGFASLFPFQNIHAVVSLMKHETVIKKKYSFVGIP